MNSLQYQSLSASGLGLFLLFALPGCGGPPLSRPASPAAEIPTAAEASFARAEAALESFLASRIKGQLADIPHRQRRMMRDVKRLKRAYVRIWARGGGVVNVAALCRIGVVYDHYCRQILGAYRRAQVPAHVIRLGRGEVQRHNHKLNQFLTTRMLPALQQASRWYRRCAAASAEYHVSQDYAAEARIRMRSLSRVRLAVRPVSAEGT